MNLVAEAPSKHARVLRVQGSVDGETFGRLLVEAQQLVMQGARCLVIDLSECEYMSSAGIMALTSVFKQLRELTRSEVNASWENKNVLERAGEVGPARQLVLVNPCPPVARVLNLAGVSAYIPIFPDVAQAVQQCK